MNGDTPQLMVDASCPECGAAFEAEIWDRSHVCQFCSSLLVFAHDPERDAFAVSDGRSDAQRPLEILIAHECEAYRARLLARVRGASGLDLDAATFDGRVKRHRRALERELRLEESLDFFVPYRIVDTAVAQAVLGRRDGGAKESFLQLFHVQEIARGYDAARYHLRDRGLKIHGFRLTRLARRHLELAPGRFLAPVPAAAAAGPAPDRTRTRLHAGTQIIHRRCGPFRGRDLTVYKHLSYARVSRRGHAKHYLFDRQFGTIAARLEPGEARRFSRLDGCAQPLLPRSDLRAIASECPNCGHELTLPRREHICFCEGCLSAVSVRDKGLELVPYLHEPARAHDAAARLVWFPFWVFPFVLHSGERRFTRVHDWLEAVAPQRLPSELRESYDDPGRYLVPARSVYGTPDADPAFELLLAHASWRQPELVRDRPVPEERATALGVDVEPAEARALAHYGLVALHDMQSTRKLDGRSFRRFVADAELATAAPELALIPLPVHDGAWRPAGLHKTVALELLARAPELARLTRSFGLRARPRGSSS